MKFSSDELMPFFEARIGMSKLLVDVQTRKETVITRYGMPISTLIVKSELYRYRELEQVMTEEAVLLNTSVTSVKLDNVQKALLVLTNEAGNLLTKTEGSKL